jgi:hypothetical protein
MSIQYRDSIGKYTVVPATSMMPKNALKKINEKIDQAIAADDIEAIRKLLSEMKKFAELGLAYKR